MTVQTSGNAAETISLGETDSLTPYEFYATFKRSTFADPERRLMAAVLEDAVTCLTFNQPRYSRRQQKEFAAALAWVNEKEDTDWVFSFVNICEALNMDPGYLRRGLNAWSAVRHRPKEVIDARSGQRNRAPGLRHKRVRLRTVS